MNELNNVPDELEKAYHQTDYSFSDGTKTIVIRLDEANPDRVDYLNQEQITSWAYMTAWNPTFLSRQTNTITRNSCSC
jgi:hypothetical protein